MEILSTGEKIKRARVYKGYTLKEVCGDKISVSKMSCIENNKVSPEDWILEFVSKKLELDPNYLKQGVKEQIKSNIDMLKENKESADYEERLKYNLEYAERYALCDIAVEIVHLLFNYYLRHNKLEVVQVLSSKYYDLYQKSHSEENQHAYYLDMANYLYSSREFFQAASYYDNVKQALSAKEDKTEKIYERLVAAIYNESACYAMTKNYEKAYEIAIELLDLLHSVKKDLKKAEIYHMLAMLSLRLGKGNFEEYEQKSYEYYKDDDLHKAQAIYNYAAVMFDVNLEEKGVTYIKKGLESYPKDNKSKLVKYMLLSVDALLEKDFLEDAQVICDNALNYAINLDDIKFVEKAYYYKSVILQKKGEYVFAEMYMNLSLDSLVKFGTKKELYDRYLEMGNMYYKLNNIPDSIKYFSLALKIEKRM